MATVLVIEDSAPQRAEICRALEGSVCFDRILEAEDGFQGLKRLVSEHIDIVLCDLELPGLDGEKLLRMRSSARSGSDTPFVFLTAVTDAERRVNLLRAGASDSICKPFHSSDLVARLELHLKMVRLQRELTQKNKLLEEMSTTDPLTGLRNRRYLTDVLSVEFMRAKRYGSMLAVALLDVDHFKGVNDAHGHEAGDRVLKGIAEVLGRHLRRSDHGGRYGGEEFLVVLANVTPAGAELFAERLRGDIEAAVFTTDEGTLELTASIGVASFSPSLTTPSELVARADAALYEAKQAGRNRVVIADPPE
jgi:diguanylate cyclase (GGDEF)-like protein